MALASGELSAIGGKMVLMTATATLKTVRLLLDQMPEIRKWKMIMNSPLRESLSIMVPPPEILSPKFEVSLQPFISRMKMSGEVYLILVRGTFELFLVFHFDCFILKVSTKAAICICI